MRRALAAAIGGFAALLLLAGTASAAPEPVTVVAEAPESVTVGVPFKLEVTVEAEAGVLDRAAQPLLLGVKMAPECGGSFVGTPGGALLERTLSVPGGSGLKQSFSTEVTATETGTETLCGYLQDSEERQFATDTTAEVKVLSAEAAKEAEAAKTDAEQKRACTAATQRSAVSRLNLKKMDRRIAKMRRRMRQVRGAELRAMSHKLNKLRAKRHKLARLRRRRTATTAGVCS